MYKPYLSLIVMLLLVACKSSDKMVIGVHVTEFAYRPLVERWLRSTEFKTVVMVNTKEAPAGILRIDTKDKIVVIFGGYFKGCVTNAIESCLLSGCKEVQLPIDGIMVGDTTTLGRQLDENWKNNTFIPGYVFPFLHERLSTDIKIILVNRTIIIIPNHSSPGKNENSKEE